ncbi:MAG: hypothetical protein AB7W59_30705 [Acidimicrobiia bacterium]
MSSISETQKETAQIIAEAVSEIAAEAITPAVTPFAQELRQATGRLLKEVNTLDQNVAATEAGAQLVVETAGHLRNEMAEVHRQLATIDGRVSAGVVDAMQRIDSSLLAAVEHLADLLAMVGRRVDAVEAEQRQSAALAGQIRGELEATCRLVQVTLISVWVIAAIVVTIAVAVSKGAF